MGMNTKILGSEELDAHTEPARKILDKGERLVENIGNSLS